LARHSGECPPNGQGLRVEVQVRPPQPERFATPQAQSQDETGEGFQAVSTSDFKSPGRLRGVEGVVQARASHRGPVGESDYVADHETVPFGEAEGTPENGACEPSGIGAVPG
jgi:hypothetical protein